MGQVVHVWLKGHVRVDAGCVEVTVRMDKDGVGAGDEEHRLTLREALEEIGLDEA